MKFSEQWLREWVNPPISTAELAEQLTMAGLEVDAIEPTSARPIYVLHCLRKSQFSSISLQLC